jgi:hypothetical protein
MAFSNFTLQSVQEQFGISVTTNTPLFQGVRPIDIGPAVHSTLKNLGQLALRVNTEKARSEWLIAPILGELWLRERSSICLLSGVDFTFDKESGLTGVVDFLVGKGPQLPYVTAPVLAVVEGKNESIPGGQGQCAAEMLAALKYNQKAKTPVDMVYGVVTTGDNWLFHQLRDGELIVDTRQYIAAEADHIFGILMHIVGKNPADVNYTTAL